MSAEQFLYACLTRNEATSYLGQRFPQINYGGGPTAFRIGRRTRYLVVALEAFIVQEAIQNAPRTLPKRDLMAAPPPTMPMREAARYMAVDTAHLHAVCSAGQGPMYIGIELPNGGVVPYFRDIDILDFVGAPVLGRRMDA